MNDPMILALEDLTLGYERHPAVHHVSMVLRRGERVALVGPNGGGKSTLLRGLLGELPPLSGDIHWFDRRARVAYLPQRQNIDRDFPLSVFRFAALGLWPTHGVLGRVRIVDRQRIQRALERVGLGDRSQQPISALSGGQFQRLLFARLLLQEADVLLLDEPFAGIDEATIEDLLDLLVDLNQRGVTVLAVLHDLNRVTQYFPRCWLLARELIAAGATAEVLTDEHLRRARHQSLRIEPDAPLCHRSPAAMTTVP